MVSILTIKMIYFICNFYFHSQFDGNISTTLINQFNPKKSIIDGVLRIQTCVCGMKGTFAGIYLVASLTIQNICIFLVHVLWRGQDSEQRVGAAHQDRDQPQDQGSFDAVHRQQQQQGQMLQNIFDMLWADVINVEIMQSVWLKLVTWLSTANHSASSQHSIAR